MANCTPDPSTAPADSTLAWRQRYEALGLRTIPFVGKVPLAHRSWTGQDPRTQRDAIAPDMGCNIGILLGNGVAVVDTDDDETSESVDCGLRSMGLSPLTAKTPRGSHFYLRLADTPVTYNSSRLPAEVGKGEFRARNCYVVAPPSQVNGIPYWWMNGSPEALIDQPVVQWRDLSWFVPEDSTLTAVDAVPIRLLHRNMSEKVSALLKDLARLPKGESVERYRSRSDAEAAVIANLILAGWPYGEILSTFDKWRPGKYWGSVGKDRQAYFDRTYYRALSAIAAHPTRVAVARCWHAVNANPLWSGANGYTKRDTLLALLALCWQFGNWEIFAPQRALAEYAATSQVCISKTLRALCSDGLVDRLNSERDLGDADHLRVNTLGFVSSEVMICDNPPRTEEWDFNELWSASALGRSAGTIYGLLSETPVSVTWLSRQTGKA